MLLEELPLTLLWLINNTQYNNININLNAMINFNSQGNLGFITFNPVISALNNTRVICIANFTSGSVIYSEECHIIVQG